MALGSLPRFRKRHSDSTQTGTQSPARDGVIKQQPGDAQARTKTLTKTRRNAIIAICIFYLVSIPFLILVEIGNTRNAPVLKDTYFFKLDLSDIVPASVPSLTLVNSIARTLGLHDFYQVGLWNFCEGYDDEGIVRCSQPQSLYWFNPVEILMNELFAGAAIALPSQVNDILMLLRIVSNIMFGFFLVGLLLNFLLMLATPIVLYSRWWSLPFGLLSGLSALFVTVASIIATVMSLVFKIALTSQEELNVKADYGVKMFAFMWIAAGCTSIAWMIHAALGCCCTSRRDVVTGRKGGRQDRQEHTVESGKGEKSGLKLPKFRRQAAVTSD